MMNKENIMAKSKKKQVEELKVKIKEMENKKRKDATIVQPEKKMSFDSWYHQRSSKIPKQHMKEILAADFKSRGLKDEATMEEYDKALKLYGVNL